MSVDALSEDPLKAHVAYLEEEVKKLHERASKLEAMLTGLESSPKKLELQGLIGQLREQANEYRKYIKLMRLK